MQKTRLCLIGVVGCLVVAVPVGAATFTVTNTNDSGAGSLRQAILDANANAGADVIEFNIPTSDPNFVDVDAALAGGDAAADAFVIKPLSAFPALNDATGGTTIDGRTQANFGGDTNPFGPEIVLDGSMTGEPPGDFVVAVLIVSDDNQVFDLNIQSFSGDAIRIILGDNNWVAGNYIGTDATGTVARGNNTKPSFTGAIRIEGQFNVIGTNGDGVDDAAERNIISGNIHGSGVFISGVGAVRNVVAGNHIGTDVTGTAALGNGSGVGGVVINGGAHLNVIGTDGSNDPFNANERNIISGNLSTGVDIRRPGTNNNVVAGNYIGTDVTGTAALGNGSSGVGIGLGAQFNVIGTNGDGVADSAERNVISANPVAGVSIGPDGHNVVAGNYIGTDKTGMAGLGSQSVGVRIEGGSSFNRIGTDGSNDPFNANERNIISGHPGTGVDIVNASDNNVVAGNFIGTDVTGTVALGNQSGVIVGSGSQFNRIGTNGDGVADAAERNIISANGENGVRIRQAGSNSNVVAGNYIGTDVIGTTALGNGFWGVLIQPSSQFNRIGTNGDGVADAAERNIISASGIDGVLVSSDSNVVAGNYIGTDVTGATALGNARFGVVIAGQSNRVGTNGDGVADADEGNIIVFNGTDGVAVGGATATGNSIQGNSIHSNVGLGINLAGGTEVFGVTANDAADTDVGANNLQNFPELTSATSGGVEGTLSTTPNTTFRVEFFANSACDPSGFGEGETFLGFTSVTTDAIGDASFTAVFPVPLGQIITATATDPNGNTSEFSSCDVTVTVTDADGDGLLDATEVELRIANESDCPDPLNPDSDGDTISDGDEVLVLGTDPCNPDSDGDGVGDATDPTPLDPGVPPEFLEGLARDLCAAIQALDLALFNGPNDNANAGRRNALANRGCNAANRIADGHIDSAIALLESLLAKIDGESPPPDWMDEPPEALVVEVVLLIALLLLEL